METQEICKSWVVINPKDSKFKDSIPFSSKEDIGRRVIKRNETSWACIGIVISFQPMEEARLGRGAAVPGEIGDDVHALQKAGYKDRWRILYGNKAIQDVDAIEFVHGLQSYAKAISSTDFRNNLKLKLDMLDYSSIPPGFDAVYSSDKTSSTAGNITIGIPNTTNNKDNANITACQICHSQLESHKLIPCDKCHLSYHIDCLTPPLLIYPSRTWICTNCIEYFTCELCKKVFKSKAGYRYHMKNVCKPLTDSIEEDLQISQDITKNNHIQNKQLHVLETIVGGGEEDGVLLGADVIQGNRSKRERKQVAVFTPTLKGKYAAETYRRNDYKDDIDDDEERDIVVDNYDEEETSYDNHRRSSSKHTIARRSGFDKVSTDRTTSSSSVLMTPKKRRKILHDEDDNDDEDEDFEQQQHIDEDSDDDDDDDNEVDDDDDEDEEDDDVIVGRKRTQKRHSHSKGSRISKSTTKNKVKKSSRNASSYDDDTQNNKNSYIFYRRKFMHHTAYQHALTSLPSNEYHYTTHDIHVPTSTISSTTTASKNTADNQSSQNNDPLVGVYCSLFDSLWKDDCIPMSTWIQSYPSLQMPTTSVIIEDNDKTFTIIPPFHGILRGQGVSEYHHYMSGTTTKTTATTNLDIHDTSSSSSSKTNLKKKKETHLESKSAVDGSDIDYFLNTAGPIWDLSFTSSPRARPPVPSTSQKRANASTVTTKQSNLYLAVGLSRFGWPNKPIPISTTSSLSPGAESSTLNNTLTGEYGFAQDIPYVVGKAYKYPNMLQIWGIHLVDDDSSNSVLSPSTIKKKVNMTMPLMNMSGTMMIQNSTSSDSHLSTSTSKINSKQQSVSLHYTVGFPNRGPVWKVSWLPVKYIPLLDMKTLPDKSQKIGTLSSNSGDGSNLTQPNTVTTHIDKQHAVVEQCVHNLLGVVAVVCGDGSCLILVLPKNIHTYHEYVTKRGTPVSAAHVETEMDIEHPTHSNKEKNHLVNPLVDTNNIMVIQEKAVCKWEIKVENKMILSIDWSENTPWQLICGMSDGSITLWNLLSYLSPSSSSSLNQHVMSLSNTVPTMTATRPSSIKTLSQPSAKFIDIQVDPRTASLSAVTSVRYCPYNPNLFATTGFDCNLKVWNIHDSFQPVYIKKSLLGWIYDCQFDPYGHGLYSCGSDGTQISWEPMWITNDPNRKNLYSHATKLAGVWKIRTCMYDGQTLCASVSSDGSIRCAFASEVIYKKGSVSTLYYQELMRIHHVEERVISDISHISRLSHTNITTTNTTTTESSHNNKYYDRSQQQHTSSGSNSNSNSNIRTTLQDSPSYPWKKIASTTATSAEDTTMDTSTTTNNKLQALKCGYVKISLEKSNLKESDHMDDVPLNKTCPPTQALHGLAVYNLSILSNTYNIKDPYHNNDQYCMFAYGGASGIVRVHTRHLLKDVTL